MYNCLLIYFTYHLFSHAEPNCHGHMFPLFNIHNHHHVRHVLFVTTQVCFSPHDTGDLQLRMFLCKFILKAKPSGPASAILSQLRLFECWWVDGQCSYQRRGDEANRTNRLTQKYLSKLAVIKLTCTKVPAETGKLETLKVLKVLKVLKWSRFAFDRRWKSSLAPINVIFKRRLRAQFALPNPASWRKPSSCRLPKSSARLLFFWSSRRFALWAEKTWRPLELAFVPYRRCGVSFKFQVSRSKWFWYIWLKKWHDHHFTRRIVGVSLRRPNM